MNMLARTDSTWQNTMSALGGARDKSRGVRPQCRMRLSRGELVALHDQNSIAYRVVRKLPEDAFSTPWRVVPGRSAEVDDDELLRFRQHLDDVLGLTTATRDAAVWSRLYGASLLTLPISDGRKPHEPLDLLNVQRMYRPAAVSAPDVLPTKYDSAFGSPTYRQLLEYQVQSLGANGTHLVHHSKAWLFEPIKLPIEERLFTLSVGYNGFGPSVLEQVYTEIANEGAARQYANSMLYTASLLFVKLNGMANTLTTDGGKEKVTAAIEAIAAAMSSLGVMGLDADDDIGSVDRSFAGAPDLLEKQLDAVGAVLPMPREIGLNLSENGLRGGELSGARALWNATVEAYRAADLVPALVYMIRIASRAYGLHLGDFSIEFDPLWKPDEKESAETAERNAKTDSTYVDMGAISVREVRNQRFVLGNRGALELDTDDGNVQDRGLWLGPALEIVKAVAGDEIPRDAGAQLLLAGGYSVSMLGSAGQTPEQAESAAVAFSQGPPPDDLIPVEEAGGELGMVTATITAAVKRGELTLWQIGGRRSVSRAAVWALAQGSVS